MFKKGQSGNPAGKKPGTKDKKWAHIQTFWDKFEGTWDKLSNAEKARYAFEGFRLHFDRAMSRLPADQDESLANAIAAQNRLNQLEDNAQRGMGPHSNQPGMENGAPEVPPPVASV